MAPPKRPPIERLMEKVQRLENGCWEWIHYLGPNGYARLWLDGKNVGAHRWSYEYHVGPIPAGLHIDHLCRNRACVNPNHLEPVTCAENVRRGEGPEVLRERRRQIVRCPQGHAYDEDNTLLDSKGGRQCRACKRNQSREYYERNRELVIQRSAEWRTANLERSRELAREGQRRYRTKKKAA